MIKHVAKTRKYDPVTEKMNRDRPEGGQTPDPGDKDFKSAFKNTFKELRKIIDKDLRESRRAMGEQIENIEKKK